MTVGEGRAAIPPAPPQPRQLGDLAAVALAASTWMGARLAVPTPLLPAAGLVGLALVARRPWVLVAACGLFACSLGSRSLAGLEPPPRGPVDGPAHLVADPQPSDHGASAEARMAGRRVVVQAADGAAGSLLAARAGEVVHVEGRVRPPAPGAAWMVPRHLAGVVQASAVERLDAGPAWARAANRVRSTVDRSTVDMAPDVRALYLGFVLGDDRAQAATLVDDFRGTGLSHLMVVSGQNLAFVLVLLEPLRRRAGPAGRWGLSLGVVLAFAAITRFEPSVLRAGAMVLVATSGQVVGRPSPPWRNLALAVTVLVLIDPLLVRSIGFQLSAAATAAIAVLGPPLAALLPGPRSLAAAVATSAAAQVGVAPILLGFAGGIPVVAVPANVLAGPAAALVTVYGLPAGVAGGVLGHRAAELAHLPTGVGVAWVAAVARVGARLPLGELGRVHLGVLVGCALVARAHPGLRWVAGLAAVATLLAPAWVLRAPPVHVRTEAQIVVWRAEGVTVVEVPGRVREEELLRDLRRAGARRVDVLVVDGDGTEAATLLRHRWEVVRVVDERTAAAAIEVGPLVVQADPPHDPSVGLR